MFKRLFRERNAEADEWITVASNSFWHDTEPINICDIDYIYEIIHMIFEERETWETSAA